ncbi:amidohydrolase family protein [Oceanicaulis sp. LC35]|uniref:amidohydrolase family protein n=1 Tax=Oceanicaulis sp. LC35 TaxID=3349635 RepID=UPI003F83D3D0
MRQLLRAVVLSVIGLGSAGTALAVQPAPDGLDPVEPYLAFEEGPVLIEHVLVLDGTGAPAQPDMSVLLEDGRITRLAPSSELDVSGSVRRVDGEGRTLIPGIVGAHNHTHMPGAPLLQRAASRLYLAGGVTTIRTVGAASPIADLAMAEAAETGSALSPRVATSAPYVSGPGDAPVMVQPASEDEARAFVRRWAETGVGWIKLYRRVEPHIAAAVIDEAHAHGLRVAGHLCSLTFEEASALGIDTIEHGLVSASDFLADKPEGECIGGTVPNMAHVDAGSDAAQRVFATLVENGTALVSTLAIVESRFAYRYQGEERIVRYLAPAFQEAYEARQAQLSQSASETDASFDNALAFERAFFEAGGLLAAGIDPGRHNLPGFGDQRNYALFLEAGFSPAEALQVMTLNGARVVGREDELGSVEAGKLADLVLLEGDLIADPQAITRPVLVFLNGRAYDPAALLDGLEGQVGLQ